MMHTLLVQGAVDTELDRIQAAARMVDRKIPAPAYAEPLFRRDDMDQTPARGRYERLYKFRRAVR